MGGVQGASVCVCVPLSPSSQCLSAAPGQSQCLQAPETRKALSVHTTPQLHGGSLPHQKHVKLALEGLMVTDDRRYAAAKVMWNDGIEPGGQLRQLGVGSSCLQSLFYGLQCLQWVRTDISLGTCECCQTVCVHLQTLPVVRAHTSNPLAICTLLSLPSGNFFVSISRRNNQSTSTLSCPHKRYLPLPHPSPSTLPTNLHALHGLPKHVIVKYELDQVLCRFV